MPGPGLGDKQPFGNSCLLGDWLEIRVPFQTRTINILIPRANYVMP